MRDEDKSQHSEGDSRRAGDFEWPEVVTRGVMTQIPSKAETHADRQRERQHRGEPPATGPAADEHDGHAEEDPGWAGYREEKEKAYEDRHGTSPDARHPPNGQANLQANE